MKFSIYKRKNGRFEEIGRKNKTAAFTFQDIAYQWLSSTQFHVKESTYARYAYVLRKYLVPVFGNAGLYMIDEITIRNFINRLLTRKSVHGKKPLSAASVGNITVILKMIYAFAEKNYFIFNPVKNIRVNKHSLKKNFLSDENWQKICRAIEKDDGKTADAIAFAVYTGLRIGEICALQKKDIDLDNNFIIVQKTVQRVNNPATNRKKTKLMIGGPKTGTSCRLVPIPDILLKRAKKFCRKQKADDFLFDIDGKVLEPRTLQYRFKKFLQKNDIPVINFHQLRHKFAGKCVEKNVDIKVLSEILGHGSISTTLNYYVHPAMSFKRRQINMAMSEI